VIPAAVGAEGTRIREVPVADLDRRLASFRLPAGREVRGLFAAWLRGPGRHQPLLATDAVEEGVLVLLDGFKRLAWLAEQGEERVFVAVLSLPRPDALAAMAQANAGRRGLTALEEAWIVASLHRDDGLDQVEISRRLGRHKSWVCRRIGLSTRLEEKVQEDVRLGLIPPSTAREIVRLPRGNQATAAEAVCRHGLSARDTHRLVQVLLEADPEQRQAILRDPRQELSPSPREPAPAADPRLGRVANRIRGQVLRIHSAALRLEAILFEGSRGSFRAEERRLLATLSGPVLEKVKTVLKRTRELGETLAEVKDAG
jgi:hypothetical protein